eukprot:SAG31_NODE_14957_length_778_cov_1.288660_1_plen_234_part_10
MIALPRLVSVASGSSAIAVGVATLVVGRHVALAVAATAAALASTVVAGLLLITFGWGCRLGLVEAVAIPIAVSTVVGPACALVTGSWAQAGAVPLAQPHAFSGAARPHEPPPAVVARSYGKGLCGFLERRTASRRRQLRLAAAAAARGFEGTLISTIGAASLAFAWMPPLQRFGQVMLAVQIASIVVCWFGMLPLLGMIGPASNRVSIRLLYEWPCALIVMLGCHRGCPCCSRA